jgi:hypothetical protein
MRTEMRLKRIEEATGVNEPCEVCDHIEASIVQIEELALRLGVPLSEATPPEMAFPCHYCLRVKYIKVGEFSLSERVLFERLHAAYDAGTLCTPENYRLRDEIGAACDGHSRAEWGEHFPALQSLTSEQHENLAQICAHLIPRKIYLCRVSGCGCNHSKTEEEWRTRVSKRRAA